MTIKSIKTGFTGISALAGNDQWFGDFEAIASSRVPSGGVATVEFASIPSTYQHLQLRVFGQISNVATTSATMRMKINSSTTANRAHQLYGNGSSVAAYSGTTGEVGWLPYSGNANIFGVAIIDILDYANTNKAKTIRTLTGFDKNGTGGEMVFASVLFTGTTAISGITLETPGTGEPFTQYSHFALYGIRG